MCIEARPKGRPNILGSDFTRNGNHFEFNNFDLKGDNNRLSNDRLKYSADMKDNVHSLDYEMSIESVQCFEDKMIVETTSKEIESWGSNFVISGSSEIWGCQEMNRRCVSIELIDEDEGRYFYKIKTVKAEMNEYFNNLKMDYIAKNYIELKQVNHTIKKIDEKYISEVKPIPKKVIKGESYEYNFKITEPTEKNVFAPGVYAQVDFTFGSNVNGQTVQFMGCNLMRDEGGRDPALASFTLDINRKVSTGLTITTTITIPDVEEGSYYLMCCKNGYPEKNILGKYSGDVESARFAISNPTIAVTSPNDGNVYNIGDDLKIEWVANNDFFNKYASQATIQLKRDKTNGIDPVIKDYTNIVNFKSKSLTVTIPKLDMENNQVVDGSYYISVKYNCWNLGVYNWCDEAESGRFLIQSDFTASPLRIIYPSITDSFKTGRYIFVEIANEAGIRKLKLYLKIKQFGLFDPVLFEGTVEDLLIDSTTKRSVIRFSVEKDWPPSTNYYILLEYKCGSYFCEQAKSSYFRINKDRISEKVSEPIYSLSTKKISFNVKVKKDQIPSDGFFEVVQNFPDVLVFDPPLINETKVISSIPTYKVDENFNYYNFDFVYKGNGSVFNCLLKFKYDCLLLNKLCLSEEIIGEFIVPYTYQIVDNYAPKMLYETNCTSNRTDLITEMVKDICEEYKGIDISFKSQLTKAKISTIFEVKRLFLDMTLRGIISAYGEFMIKPGIDLELKNTLDISYKKDWSYYMNLLKQTGFTVDLGFYELKIGYELGVGVKIHFDFHGILELILKYQRNLQIDFVLNYQNGMEKEPITYKVSDGGKGFDWSIQANCEANLNIRPYVYTALNLVFANASARIGPTFYNKLQFQYPAFQPDEIYSKQEHYGRYTMSMDFYVDGDYGLNILGFEKKETWRYDIMNKKVMLTIGLMNKTTTTIEPPSLDLSLNKYFNNDEEKDIAIDGLLKDIVKLFKNSNKDTKVTYLNSVLKELTTKSSLKKFAQPLKFVMTEGTDSNTAISVCNKLNNHNEYISSVEYPYLSKYRNDIDECSFENTDCSQYSNCEKCDSTKCTQCSGNYKLYNGYCYDCSRYGECEKCNSNECTECSGNYKLYNGYCYDCSKYGECEKCNGYECKQCSGNNKLYNGYCYDCSWLNNCEKCNNNECKQCSDNYKLNEDDGKCYDCSKYDNCEKCDSNGCVNCRNGYNKNNNGECVKIYDCSKFGECDVCDDYECTQCSGNYKLNDGYCYNCSKFGGCEKCNNYECKECSDNYKLNEEDGKCYDCSKFGGCEKCDNYECKECSDNYKLNDGYCYDCSWFSHCENCTYYECTECSSNFILNDGRCYDCSQYGHCENCTYYECTECSGNYKLNDGRCYDCSQYSHCENCNEYGCTECSGDYILSNGECHEEIEEITTDCSKFDNCWKCDNTNCLECNIGYVQVNDECKYNHCSDRGCISCDYDDKSLCGSCEENFELKDGTCVEIEQEYDCSNIYKCLECNKDGCTVCDYGYTEVYGYCEINYCDWKCLECKENQNNYCAKCIDGYSVYDENYGYCVENPLCSSFSENGVCVGCENTYSISRYHVCISNIRCTKTNSEGVCIDCEEGYTLDDNYYCTSNPRCSKIKDGRCTFCEDGYVLDWDNYLCLEDKDCLEVDNEIDFCIKCVEGKSLNYITKKCEDNPQCLSRDNKEGFCIECSDGYSVNYNNELCMYNPQCLNTSSYGYCEVCNNGYILDYDNHICVEDSHCEEIKDSDCTKCSDGYTISYLSGVCVQNENCKEIDISDGCCTKCNDGYYFNRKRICSNQFCEMMDQYGYCIKCENGFTRDESDGECKLNEKCTIVDPDGICIKCDVGYEINETTYLCQPYVDRSSIITTDCSKYDNCVECNERGCVTCEYGYVEENGNCIESYCFDSACLYCDYNDETKCGECMNGYVLVEGKCEKIPNKCLKFGNCVSCSDDYCYECAYSYTIQNDKCVEDHCHVKECKGCSSESLCAECDDNYDLINGICQFKGNGFYWYNYDNQYEVYFDSHCIYEYPNSYTFNYINETHIKLSYYASTSCSDLEYWYELPMEEVGISLTKFFEPTIIFKYSFYETCSSDYGILSYISSECTKYYDNLYNKIIVENGVVMDYYYSDSSCSQFLEKSPLGECNKCSISNFQIPAHYVEIECVGFDDDSSSSNPNDSNDKPTDSSDKPTDSSNKPTDSSDKPTDSSSKQLIIVALIIALIFLI